MASNQPSDACPLIFPEKTLCSGNGDCLVSPTTGAPYCECSSEFTSIGDFALFGVACDLHRMAVRYLWLLPLVASVLNLFVCFRYIYFRAMVVRATRGSAAPSRWSDSMNYPVYNCTAFATFMFIWSVLKISSNDPGAYAVGISLSGTFLLGLVYNFFWSTQISYLIAFLGLALKQSRILDANSKAKTEVLKRIRVGLGLVLLANIAFGFLPLALLKEGLSKTAQFSVVSVHYVGAAVSLGYLAFRVVQPAAGKIHRDIVDSIHAMGNSLHSPTVAGTPSSNKSLRTNKVGASGDTPKSGSARGAASALSSSFGKLLRESSKDPAEKEPNSPQAGSTASSLSSTTASGTKSMNARNRSAENRVNAMKAAARKLESVIGFSQRAAVQEIIIACLFAFFPFLTRKASYQIPLTYSVGLVLTFLEIYSLSNFGTTASNRPSSGNEDLEGISSSELERQKNGSTQPAGGAKSCNEQSSSQVFVAPLNNSGGNVTTPLPMSLPNLEESEDSRPLS